jgi:ribosomal protein S18 acetylase RimI-like enzyme
MSAETLIEIVTYRPELQPEFERLNRRWLEASSLLEQPDLDCLLDPETYVLSTGGQVFFAMENGNVVGTCAAIRVPPSTVELAKLAVSPEAHGRGIGRRLCNHVLEFSRSIGATEVELTSNSALIPAITLYESLGFRHAPLPADIRYATADVYMTLRL